HPGSRASGSPGPTEKTARWVPALPRIIPEAASAAIRDRGRPGSAAAQFEGGVRPTQSRRSDGGNAHLAAFLRVEQHDDLVALGIDELPFARAHEDELARNRHAGIGDGAGHGFLAAGRL